VTIRKLNVVEGRTIGCQKRMSESDGTASDSVPPEAASSAPDEDQVDASVHTRPVDLQKCIHEKADMLIAQSAVSGKKLILFHMNHSSNHCCATLCIDFCTKWSSCSILYRMYQSFF